MPRSKSPAARKSASAGNDAHIQAAISLGVLVVAIVWSAGFDVSKANPQEGAWTAFFSGGGNNIDNKYWPYGVLVTLHALNTAQSASSGFWLGSAIGNYFATFAPTIVAALFFKGGNFAGVIDANNAALAGAAWFIVNNAIGGFNVWDEIKKASNGALDWVLSASTMAFTLNAALSAADNAPKIESWQSVVALITTATIAAVVADAGNYFPLDKGFSFDGFSDLSNRAFTTVCIVAIATSFNLAGHFDVVAKQFGAATATDTAFLVTANVLLNFITGSGACPAFPDPIAMVQDKLYEITGFSR